MHEIKELKKCKKIYVYEDTVQFYCHVRKHYKVYLLTSKYRILIIISAMSHEPWQVI